MWDFYVFKYEADTTYCVFKGRIRVYDYNCFMSSILFSVIEDLVFVTRKNVLKYGLNVLNLMRGL